MGFRIVKKNSDVVDGDFMYKGTKDIDDIKIIDKDGNEHGLDKRRYSKNKVIGHFYHKVGRITVGGKGQYNFPFEEEEAGVVLEDGTVHYINVCRKCNRKKDYRNRIEVIGLNVDLHPINISKLPKSVLKKLGK